MEEQTHREPTLYIVGNDKRCNEIKNIIENEWGGKAYLGIPYNKKCFAFFINSRGSVDFVGVSEAQKLSDEGWMKEYELPKKEKCGCEFKPFDKIVVRLPNRKWCANMFSHVVTDKEGNEYIAIISGCCVEECLPYNEYTAKMIGTNEEFDYDKLK